MIERDRDIDIEMKEIEIDRDLYVIGELGKIQLVEDLSRFVLNPRRGEQPAVCGAHRLLLREHHLGSA